LVGAPPMTSLSPRLKEFLQRWAITTVAVVIAEQLVPGLEFKAWTGLVIAALILGALNMVLRPLLIAASVGLLAALNIGMGIRMALLTLPLQIILFGFLLLAINACLLMAVAMLVSSPVNGFWPAFWGGVVISLATLFLNSLTGSGNARISVRRGSVRPDQGPRRPDDRDGPSSGGPIIDV
jgi:putative membrane protein